MEVAEDITTLATMVSACEVAEVTLAGGFVTDSRFWIGLYRSHTAARQSKIRGKAVGGTRGGRRQRWAAQDEQRRVASCRLLSGRRNIPSSVSA